MNFFKSLIQTKNKLLNKQKRKTIGIILASFFSYTNFFKFIIFLLITQYFAVLREFCVYITF